ncbi:hypothetical protein BDR06DRAFT_1060941, partial [Suillus hirtellus]
MNVSGAMNMFDILVRLSIIVVALPVVLYLNTQTCCKKVSRYTPSMLYPPLPLGSAK